MISKLKVKNSKGRLVSGEKSIRRGDLDDPFVGKPGYVSGNFLPSEGEVFNHFRLVQLSSEQKGEDGRYKSSSRASMLATAEALGEVWCKGPYPTISREGIVKRIEKTQADVRNLHRNISKSSARAKAEEHAVKERLKTLFDISVKDWRAQIKRDRGVSEEGKKRAEEDILYLERCQRGATCNRVATFHLPRKAMVAEFKDKSVQHTFPGCTWICHRFAAGFVIVDKSKTRSVCTFVSSAGIFGLNRGNL